MADTDTGVEIQPGSPVLSPLGSIRSGDTGIGPSPRTLLAQNPDYQDPPDWQKVGDALSKQFPGIPESEIRKRFSQHRQLEIERRLAEVASNKQTTGEKVLGETGRSSLGLLPYAKTFSSSLDRGLYQAARQRFDSGQPEVADAATIARYEQQQQDDLRRSPGARIAETIASVPGQYAEFALGGAAVKGIGAAVGIPRAVAGSMIGRGVGFGAQVAAVPSAYVDRWAQNNEKQGRDQFDPTGLPAAYGLGLVHMAILGKTGQWAGKVPGLAGKGLAPLAGRMAAGGAGGLLGSELGEDLTSTVGKLVPVFSDLDTGYGPLGLLLEGKKGEAGQKAAETFLTFALFGALHEAQHGTPHYQRTQLLTDSFLNTLQRNAKAGVPLEKAAVHLSEVGEQMASFLDKNPSPTQEEARKWVDSLPAKMHREFPMALVHLFPEGTEGTVGGQPLPPTPPAGQTVNEPGTVPPGAVPVEPQAQPAPEAPPGPAPAPQAPAAATEAPAAPQATPGPAKPTLDAVTFADLAGVAKKIGTPYKGLSRDGLLKKLRNMLGGDQALLKQLGLAETKKIPEGEIEQVFGPLEREETPPAEPTPKAPEVTTPEAKPGKQKIDWFGKPAETTQDIPPVPGSGVVERTPEKEQAMADLKEAERQREEARNHILKKAEETPEPPQEAKPEPAAPQDLKAYLKKLRTALAGKSMSARKIETEVDASEARTAEQWDAYAKANDLKYTPLQTNYAQRLAELYGTLQPEKPQPEKLPSLEEIADQAGMTPRQKKVFLARGNGKTLEEIAVEHGTTRENERQHEVKALAKIGAKQSLAEAFKEVRAQTGQSLEEKAEGTSGEGMQVRKSAEGEGHLEDLSGKAYWRKKAEEHGIDPKELFERARELRETQKEHQARVKEALDEVKGQIGGYYSGVRFGTIKDASQVPHIDEAAQTLQRIAPELFSSRENPSDTLFRLIKESKKRRVSSVEQAQSQVFADLVLLKEAEPRLNETVRQINEELIKAGEKPLTPEEIAGVEREGVADSHRGEEGSGDASFAFGANEEAAPEQPLSQDRPEMSQWQSGLFGGPAKSVASQKALFGKEEMQQEKPAPPKPVDERQQDLFKPSEPFLKGESGAVDLDRMEELARKALPHIRDFIRDERGSLVLDRMRQLTDDIKKAIAPASRGPEAGKGAGIQREKLSEMARAGNIAHDALDAGRRYFEDWIERAPDPIRRTSRFLYFMDRMESGQLNKLPPELRPIAEASRGEIDDRSTQLAQAGLVQNFIDNYIGHLWKKPGSTLTAEEIGQIFSSRRPLAGQESFRRQRSIPTYREGIEKHGLEPISWNPVELVLRNLQQMDKSLMGRRTTEILKAEGLMQFVGNGQDGPQGWVRMSDRMGTVFAPRRPTGAGPELVGHWYLPEPVARLLENYAMPGLRGNMLYDAVRGFGNLQNMFQLGFSAFHGVFAGVEAVTSSVALGTQYLSRGKVLSAAAMYGKAAAAPVTRLLEGRRMGQEWLKPGSGSPETQEMVRYLEEAGGRQTMDDFYQTGSIERFRKALGDLRAGKLVGGLGGGAPGALFHMLPAVAELFSIPIMKKWVPPLKMGVFAEMARYEIERLGPRASDPNARREALGKAWDSVENRLGQLTYDNVFWSRTFKDVMMASIRSVGWNLGDVRELGGAVKDIPASVKGVKSGEGITPRLAYGLALPIVTGVAGAFLNYLFTGDYPREIWDCFFPRTGRKLKDGVDERLSLPTYGKDVAALLNRSDEMYGLRAGQNALEMAKGKLSPGVVTPLVALAGHEPFKGAIRDPKDPGYQQLLDTAKFILQSFEPIGLATTRKQLKEGKSLGESLQGLAGLTPAPSRITHTWEQQRQQEASRKVELTPLERRRKGLR